MDQILYAATDFAWFWWDLMGETLDKLHKPRKVTPHCCDFKEVSIFDMFGKILFWAQTNEDETL